MLTYDKFDSILKLYMSGPAQGCGGQINATDAGSIVPLRDDSGNYFSLLDCVWILTAPDDKVLSVKINGIGIESGGPNNCQFDGLEVCNILLYTYTSAYNKSVNTCC